MSDDAEMTLEKWRNAGKGETWLVSSGHLHNLIDNAIDEIDALKAENAQMRKAIETVTDRDWYFTGHNDWNDASDILKASLGKKE